jgi:hypothetical protein
MLRRLRAALCAVLGCPPAVAPIVVEAETPVAAPQVGDDPVLEDYRKHLYESLNSASRDYDQSILTLAAGTLAVSVTFAHDIATKPVPGTNAILLAAWGSLVLALVLIVISFQTSQHVIRLAIRAIDPPPARQQTRLDRAKAFLSGLAAPLTGTLNVLAGAALIAGLGLLGWYAYLNVTV